MSPLAIILKVESTPDSRTIAYETYRKQTVIIVQQEYQLDEWVTVNHMAVPIVIFDFIQSFRFEKGLMKGAQYLLDFVTSYVREFVFDPDRLDGGERKIFTIMTWKNSRCMKIKRATGEILNRLKAFGKWNQILRAQKLLANHQLLPWFMIQLSVHLYWKKIWKQTRLSLKQWKPCDSTCEQVFCTK